MELSDAIAQARYYRDGRGAQPGRRICCRHVRGSRHGRHRGRFRDHRALVGHVDSAVAGPGALFRLQAIRPGAVVTVTAAGRSWRYMVQAVRAYPKATLPAARGGGGSDTRHPLLRLCREFCDGLTLSDFRWLSVTLPGL
jgi:hypothetical protein